MQLIVDGVSWVLLTAGGAFVLIGGIGVVRMPSFYTRMHAMSLTDTMGAVLVLFGIMLQAGFTLAALKLVAILLFLLFTGPTAANALASSALLSGLRPGTDGKIAATDKPA